MRFFSKVFFSILILAFGAGFFVFLYRSERVGKLPAIILGRDYLKYANYKYKFSLEYPKELKTESFLEKDGSEIILFKSDDLVNSPKVGFQIFIIPFTGDGILTKERILRDLPNVFIEDFKPILLGTLTNKQQEAFLFWSRDPVLGKTREVWFTRGEYLYEITTYEHLDSWLAKILSTWRFE